MERDWDVVRPYCTYGLQHIYSTIRTMSKAEWTKHLDEATEMSICWYPRWNERDDTIIRCGGFPNVPLMGTQGAINYNP
ncbi:hypothetical protein CR513_18881, partial [Mucuna pruriens]